MTTNIGRDDSDASYRYKRPILRLDYQGKGKNEKTIISNLDSLCKALHTIPIFIIKFMAYYHATQSIFDGENKIGGLKGHHSFDSVNDSLNEYIQIYIICNVCKDPELNLEVHKNTIYKNCNACGAFIPLMNGIDKLDKFIIQHPPPKFKLRSKPQKFVVTSESLQTTTNECEIITQDELDDI